MAASPYWYFEKYQSDINTALQRLRRSEFEAGRYYPVVSGLIFPLTVHSPSPGAQHASIREALSAAADVGTRSILDLSRVDEHQQFGAVAPLSEDLIVSLYDNAKPTRAMVEADISFLDYIERGHGIYIILYKNGTPDEILFAGYSFD